MLNKLARLETGQWQSPTRQAHISSCSAAIGQKGEGKEQKSSEEWPSPTCVCHGGSFDSSTDKGTYMHLLWLTKHQLP